MKNYINAINFLKVYSVLICIFFRLFKITIYIYTTSCIYNPNVNTVYPHDLLHKWNNHHQILTTIKHYIIQGNIIYTDDLYKKTYIKFFWNKQNDNNYYIKLFDIFGFTIISVYIKNNLIYITPNIIYNNNDLINKIQKWFIQTHFFEKQLKKWIIGLPGNDTKYYLNNFGYLSRINYYMYNKNISIFYRYYYTYDKLMLPKALDIYYSTHHIKLYIDYWNLS